MAVFDVLFELATLVEMAAWVGCYLLARRFRLS
jgi:hypothetical protein